MGKLFKQQSEKWKTITQTHVDHLFHITKQFVEDLPAHTAGGKSSAALISDVVDPDFEAREKALRQKIEEVLKPYTNERPMTFNVNYASNLKPGSCADEISKLRPWLEHTENEIQSAWRIIQSMQAYYDTTLNVLLDNIALLVIEHCLLDDLNQTISPRSMQKQPDTQLERLAGESHDVVARRQMLDHMLHEYRRRHQLVRTHSWRPLRSSNIDWSKALRPETSPETSPDANPYTANLVGDTSEHKVTPFASLAASTSIFVSGPSTSVGPDPTALSSQDLPPRSSFGPGLTPGDRSPLSNPSSRPGSASSSATSVDPSFESRNAAKSPSLGRSRLLSKGVRQTPAAYEVESNVRFSDAVSSLEGPNHF